MTPTISTAQDSLEDIQTHDGLYGVMLVTLRNCQEKFKEDKNPERIAELAHMCLLSATQEFFRDNNVTGKVPK